MDTLPEPRPLAGKWWLAAGLALVLYVCLAMGLASSQTPFVDEGYFAPPAWSLLHAGHTGSLTLEECMMPLRRSEWLKLPGIHKRSYWHMPGYFVMQAGWYRVFGFSLFSMRALSVFAGAIWMIAAGYVAWRLTGDEWVALASTVLATFDLTVLRWAAIGRMDLLCAAFWMTGWAAYLAWRDRRPRMALAVSHTLAACSGLIHPVGGLCGLAALLWLQFRYRPRPLGWREWAAAIVPYVVLGSLWLTYILQAPGDWAEQLRTNSSGRLDAWSRPWRIIYEEIFVRLLPAYGLRAGSAWFSWLKLVTPVVLAGVIAWCVARREWRRHPVIGVLLGMFLLQGGVLALMDGVRSQSYLVYVLYAPAVLTAWVLLRPGGWRAAGAAVVILLAGLYVANAARIIQQNPRERLYEPMVALMRKEAPPDATVTGPSELAFTFGFDGRMRDDFWLGFCSGRQADYLIVSADYEDAWRSRDYPAAAVEHVERELKRYELVGEAGAYKVYRRVRPETQIVRKPE